MRPNEITLLENSMSGFGNNQNQATMVETPTTAVNAGKIRRALRS